VIIKLLLFIAKVVTRRSTTTQELRDEYAALAMDTESELREINYQGGG
jgi:hypothetical protein